MAEKVIMGSRRGNEDTLRLVMEDSETILLGELLPKLGAKEGDSIRVNGVAVGNLPQKLRTPLQHLDCVTVMPYETSGG